MRLCEETITVLNQRINPETGDTEYSPTVITGCSWFNEIAATVDPSTGLKAANKTVIRIPTDADTGGKAYVDPGKFQEAEPSETFTLRNGDLILKGSGEISGLLKSDILNNYQAVTVLGVTDNRRARAKHWKVVGS